MSLELKQKVLDALGKYEFEAEIQDLLFDILRSFDCGMPEIPGFYFCKVRGETTLAKIYIEQDEETGDLENTVSFLEIDIDDIDEGEIQWLYRVAEP
jgi:hypothetical protein